MSIGKMVNYVLVLSLLAALACGCAKQDEESDTNPETSSQSSAVDRQADESEVVTEERSAPSVPEDAETADDKLRKQREEVRQAFISLQEACKANDIDKYVASWDDETKMATDGRDLTLDQRRARRREAVMEKPERLQRFVNLTIESITLDTSKAESLKSQSGIDLEGTMMLVRTSGSDLFFHETAKGWKLYSVYGHSR